MKNCPRCGSNILTKNGYIKELQRYKCKRCGFNFTKNISKYIERRFISKRKRLIATHMRIDGMSYGFIAMHLDVSKTQAKKWVDEEISKVKNLKINKKKRHLSSGLSYDFLAERIDSNQDRLYYLIEFPKIGYYFDENCNFLSSL